MGCPQNLISCHTLCSLSIFIFFLLNLSSTQMRFMAEGRASPKSPGFSQTAEEDKTLVRAQIGSRPPRCERRCSTCGHCEAIQVPTNPQVQNGKTNSSAISSIAYAGGGGDGGGGSNYKPISWKCKCGKFIFDP